MPHRWILKPSRRRNGLLVLFALIIINLSIFHEYLLPHRLVTLEEESSDTIPHGNSSRILLVSSLFHISKSKHSKEAYHSWLQRFLGPITTEVYFYTSPDLVPTVQSARGEGLPITIDTTYNTTFDVPPMKGLEEWYNEMHSMDRENSLHSPQLYSIWNAKPFFVDNAIRVMKSKGKTYDYVFWNDGGSFREENVYKNWPDPDRIDEIWKEGSRLSGTKAEDLLFFPIQHPPYSARDWKEDMGPIDTDFSEGEPWVVSLVSVVTGMKSIFFHFRSRFILWWFPEYNGLVGTYILRLPRLLRQQTPLCRERSNRLQLCPRFIQRTYHCRMGI